MMMTLMMIFVVNEMYENYNISCYREKWFEFSFISYLENDLLIES